MVLGSKGFLLGQMERLFLHLLVKGLWISFGMGIFPSCQVIFSIMYWVCMI